MDDSPMSLPRTRLVLQGETAAELMTANPLSIRCDATLTETAAFLVGNEFSAAPVIDDAGRAVGVISHTDLSRHDAEAALHDPHDAEYYRTVDFRCPPALCEAVYGTPAESRRVGDVMTPVVVQVALHDSAVSVVAKLLALKIHRLFVADDAGTLVGVISTLDVLRRLHAESSGALRGDA